MDHTIKHYDVFISYSQKDRKEADEICKVLDDHQITYFIDKQGLNGANSISEIIAHALLHSKIFLFLGSKNSYASSFANDEVSFAKKHFQKNYILPYLLDSEPMPPGIELSLSNTLWRMKKNEPFASVVINDIEKLLDRVQEPKVQKAFQINKLKKPIIIIAIILFAIGLALKLNYHNSGQQVIDVNKTIDPAIQDTFDSLLIKRMSELKCAEAFGAVMEVSTGIPVAISSWTNKDGEYVKDENKMFKIFEDTGSSFQVISYAALIESGKISPDSQIDTGNTIDNPSSFFYHGKEIRDDIPVGSVTADEAIVQSSNIAIVKMVTEAFEDTPYKFLHRIEDLGWNNTPLMFFKGDTLRSPYIRKFGDMDWDEGYLGEISYGNLIPVTPMQTLLFFNSIANEGIRPGYGRVCSKNTAKCVRTALEHVVEHGTARGKYYTDGREIIPGAYSKYINIAGKTGLSKIYANGHRYHTEGSYATFVGYFPAESPKYSCIVTIKAQPGGNYGRPGGGYMAGPVIRELAESIFF